MTTFLTKPHYGSVPDNIPEIILGASPHSTSSRNFSHCTMERIFGVVFILLSSSLFLMYQLQSGHSESFEGEYPVRLCTPTECARARCDVPKRPYVCVDPRTPYFYRIAPGGCKSTPWTSVYCSDSCSLLHCADLLPVENGISCASIVCPLERCAVEHQPYSTCNRINVPYQVSKSFARSRFMMLASNRKFVS
jgi:hypothetical protein